MHYKTDIGDHTDHIPSVLLIEFHRFVIARCHQHFRPRSLAQQLLLLVQRISYRDTILLQYQFVQQRQVCRIVTYTVFDQQNSTHSLIENVVLCIHPILNQLDDRDNQIRGIIPVKQVVDIRLIHLLHASIHLFAERRQQYDRTVWQNPFRLFRKIPYLIASGTVNNQNQVKRVLIPDS